MKPISFDIIEKECLCGNYFFYTLTPEIAGFEPNSCGKCEEIENRFDWILLER